MDEKAKEIIAPFHDWDIGGLRFGRVMSAIDAIVESKIERLKNEMKAEIQKLQIEKTFPPESSNEDEEVRKKIEKDIELGICAEADETEVDEEEEQKLEDSKSLENKFKRTIGETLINKFSSEIYTLLDSEYYNDAKWVVTLPSYTTKTNVVSSSFHDYCRALKNKVDTLINSVNNDPNSNSFYISSRSENTKVLDSTTIIFNPKTCSINRASPFEYNKFDNDGVKLIITEDNGTKNFFQFKWHRGYSIIECDNGNPNFMLFDPINCDYTLFYKSHKMLYVNHDDKEEVNESKVWGEFCHPEDISDQYRSPKIPILHKPNVTKGKTEKSKKELAHLSFYSDATINAAEEDKRIKTRNKLKELFGGVIMTITNEREVHENFTYSNSDLRTLKKNIRKYIRNLICTIPESEPLYIYSNKNKQIDKPITCYKTRNYKIIPSSTSNNPWFDIKVICDTCEITIPILFFDRNTYFLSVRNDDSENKVYNFAIVNTKTKEFVIFTKDKFVFDGWKLEITAEKDCLH